MEFITFLQQNFTQVECNQIFTLVQQAFQKADEYQCSRQKEHQKRHAFGYVLNELREALLKNDDAVDWVFKMFGEKAGYENSRKGKKTFWSWLKYIREGKEEPEIEEPAANPGLLAVQQFLADQQAAGFSSLSISFSLFYSNHSTSAFNSKTRF